MNTQKVIMRTVYSLAGLLFITSIGINIFQYNQFRKLTKTPSPEKNIKSVSINDSYNDSRPVPAVNVEKSNTDNELQYHLEAAEEELEMTNEQLAEEQSKKEEYATRVSPFVGRGQTGCGGVCKSLQYYASSFCYRVH